MRKILAWPRRRPWLTVVLVVLILGIGFFVFRPKAKIVPALATVARGTIQQVVSVTGNTSPVHDLALAFQISGQVSQVPARVGERIPAGRVLAELSHAELSAQLAQAQANLQSAQAKLDQLLRGSRPEDISTERATLAKSEQDLANYYLSAWDAAQKAQILAEDAVRKQLDDLFTNDDQVNATLSFTSSDSAAQVLAQNSRFTTGIELSNWKKELQDAQPAFYPANSTSPSADPAFSKNILSRARSHLAVIQNGLTGLASALDNATNLSAATLTTYRGALTTARTNVNTAATNMSGLSDSISSQEAAVAKTRRELDAMLAGSDPQEIAAQRAQVAQNEAGVALVQAQLDKTVLRSPIAGVVTRQDAKIGQTVTANQNVVSVISADRLEVQANVTEVDIAKIHVGDSARITLDAYGEDVAWSAKVTAIDPAETLVEGVSTYKTTLLFDSLDERARPGMTANIDILGAQRENVLFIPARAVISREGRKFVRIYRSDDTQTEQEVQTGLRGSDGNIEIISGLLEGESVLRNP